MAPSAFAEVMQNLPADIVELERDITFPRFCVHAWKNEWPRKRAPATNRA
jgi:hypothetical protein